MKLAIKLLVLTLFFYLIGSFVAADFNIANWSEFGRYMLAVVFTFFTGGLYLEYKITNEN